MSKSGTPIYYAPEFSGTELSGFSASIKDSKGRDVPFFQDAAGSGFFLYTKKPMKTGETYTVSVKVTATYGSNQGKSTSKT
ncbi:hypothetical protein HMSSN139_06420 [Paenibacillus sp. HMSSN-139]|nr:hypothetical protein HMSSN139_06420 [Paenibacillus sp. HMSSN-139]